MPATPSLCKCRAIKRKRHAACKTCWEKLSHAQREALQIKGQTQGTLRRFNSLT